MNEDVDITWMPPSSPDPTVILHEAVDDERSGRFSLALQKHCWYFDHALEYDSAHCGVRLSFALKFWHRLAKKHPPAMDEFRARRDRASQNAIAGIDVHESFHDAGSFNLKLGETAATRDLFREIHKIDRNHAQTVYDLAQPVLVSFGDYELCNEYLDADTVIDRIIERFHFHRAQSFPENVDVDFVRQHMDDSFRNDSATVVALLMAANRWNEAHAIAERLLNEWNDKSVHDIITRALHGEFPPQRI